MAIDDPKGPGNQQPFDPNIANVFDRMASALDIANEKASNSERLLKAMAEHAGAVAENTEDATKKMRDFFKVSDDIEENYKRIVDYGKKRGNMAKKDLDDAKKARHELEALAKMYKDALGTAKKNTKETEAMRGNLKGIENLLKNMKRDGKLVGDEWQKVADVFDRASRNAKTLAAATANLSRTSATLKGIGGMLGAAGIGKGINARFNQRIEMLEEVKAKAKEAKEMRRTATQKHMEQKRSKALQEIKTKSKQFGYGDLVDVDTGEVTTDAGRDMLARKMGFKRGSKKYTDFTAGEAAGGPAAAGEAGAGWAGAMTSGGGAIESLGTMIEDGIIELTAIAPEIMIPLEILTGAIMLLVEAFDGYVKQNQEMEKGIGKGGLFTQGGVGAGEAFARARSALNPNFGVGVPLGVSYKRNLAIAEGITNAGYNVNQSFGGAAGNQANMGPGAMGEFMKGGVGEIQRIVMGAGRVGGMSDQEGVEEVIKLLDSYRETMASSEMFLTRVNKDTQAAGISTTKYLKIVDEVSSSFDKMGKSLEQVTGVMRELSRYGAVSSESLKDMMEFLEAGQQKTNMSNVQTAAFTQAIMDPKTLSSLRETEKTTLQNYIDALNAEGGKHGMKALDISSAIKSGDYTRAQGLANSMRTQISGLTDPTVKQSMTNALGKIQDQINRVSGVMSPDFLKRASSQGLYGEDPAQAIANLMTNLKKSAAMSGTSMKSLMSGGGSAEQQIMVQQLSEMLGVKEKGPGAMFKVLRQAAQNRVMDVQTATDPSQKKADAKQLFAEIYRGAKMKDGIPTFLTEKGLGKYWKGNMDDTFEAISSSDKGMDKLVDLFGYNLDTISDSSETQDKILKANADGNKTDDKSLAAQLTQARGIGMRTQTIGDLLENTFKPLLVSLVSGVEKIATWVSKHFGGDFGKDTEQTMKDMSAIPGKIDELGDTAEELMKDPSKQGDAQKALDTMRFLQGVQEHGTFLSPDEQRKVEGILSPQNPMTKAQLRMATVSGMGGAEGAAAQGGMAIYNYFDAHYNQDTTNTGSVGGSPGEHPVDPKGSSSGMGRK